MAGMEVHLWGTRGSLSYSVKSAGIEKKIRMALAEAVRVGLDSEADIDGFIAGLPFEVRGSYGCNTSCIEVRGGTEHVLCDAGTGLRDFGTHVMAAGDANNGPRTFHLFMSHLHWDHVQGFPFFVPAFIPGNRIEVYAYHENAEQHFIDQQDPPGFPLPLSAMAADITFHTLKLGQSYDIAGLRVTGYQQHHPGDTYGYRFEKDGKSVVYSTDSEHFDDVYDDDYPYVDFIRDTDLLIFDAQYNLADHFHTKANWGHSSNMIGVELAIRGGVKRLCLFHNEHTVDDHGLEEFLAQSRRYLEIYDDSAELDILLAYDGLVVAV